MDIERAQEIFEASETIPVMLNGESVWIERVDPNKDQVQVHLQSQPNERKTVSPDQLQEVVH